MTDLHRYPAALTPDEIASIERATDGYRNELIQARVVAREWQRQAEQMSTALQRVRKERDELRRIIDTETPIGALDLASTWRAEKAHYMERIEELQRELTRSNRALADMVNQYMSYPEGYVTHEFMSAQEEAIDYLEAIGWLRDGGAERYYWTDAATGTNFPLKASEG